MSAHEYDPRTDEGLLVTETVPGRVQVVLGQGRQTTRLEVDLSLFLRVVEKFLADRKKDGKTEARPSGRKSRPSEPGVDDL
jgi:hypothetical protein